MPEQQVKISKSGSVPKLDIAIGQGHWGKYRTIVWNPTGSNAERVVEGTNVDDVPDRFPLGDTVEELADRILTVELFVVSYDPTPDEPFHVKLRVLQGGSTADGGSRTFEGTLGDGGVVGRAARFRLRVVA